MSRVDPTAEKEDIENYIASNGISDFEFAQLSHEDSLYKSFKLSVDIHDRDIVLNPAMWPRGVSVRKWRVRYDSDDSYDADRHNSY